MFSLAIIAENFKILRMTFLIARLSTLILFFPGIFRIFWYLPLATAICSVPVLIPLNFMVHYIFSDPFYLLLLDKTNASINLQHRLARALIALLLLFAGKYASANICLSQRTETSLLLVTSSGLGSHHISKNSVLQRWHTSR